eukprot:scaffold698_cov61-Phaeocystis_antarctica.AAC.2
MRGEVSVELAGRTLILEWGVVLWDVPGVGGETASHASRLRHTVIGDASCDLSRAVSKYAGQSRSCSRQRAKPRHESVLTHEFEL